MSLVVFPFKHEKPEVLLGNVRTAASNHRVGEVLGIGFEEDATYRALESEAAEIQRETGTAINLIVQERIGSLRPGKGDGMNTGLHYFLDSGHDRIHFYDADITSFTSDWITRAEKAADRGFQTVRHFFPRASTDGLITWMITRVGFALLWPRTELPWIEQPLGGELLFTREAAADLARDERVQAQSDWGIDTLYSFALVKHGHSLFEVYIHDGKMHKLYGALSDLKQMLVECFTAIQSLQGEAVNGLDGHRVSPPGSVPEEIFHKLGYNIEQTLGLLREDWTDRQMELLGKLPADVHEGMASARDYPRFTFMDEDAWYDCYRVLLAEFEFGDPDWESLIFKLWVARVLEYTTTTAIRGYGFADRYLHEMVIRSIDRAREEQG